MTANVPWPRSPTGGRRRTGRTGPMQRGEVWFAATPGGGRPVLVLTRDPVASRIGAVVVAAVTRTHRGLVSELELTSVTDGVPTDCIVNFDNIHTIARRSFRREVVSLSAPRLAEACRVLRQLRVADLTLAGVRPRPDRRSGRGVGVSAAGRWGCGRGTP
jgi:mRNA interferase MazF